MNNKPNTRIVLIAEDNDTNYHYLEALMKHKKYEVLRAFNGAESVHICTTTKPLLVLMDIKMPEMDGIEAMLKIKELWPKIPVIAQTAYCLSGDEERIMAAGFDGYIPKPILRDKLYRLIDKVLEPNAV
jgi:CheY-like chemotaxis protein